jgi:hypothetical protein
MSIFKPIDNLGYDQAAYNQYLENLKEAEDSRADKVIEEAVLRLYMLEYQTVFKPTMTGTYYNGADRLVTVGDPEKYAAALDRARRLKEYAKSVTEPKMHAMVLKTYAETHMSKMISYAASDLQELRDVKYLDSLAQALLRLEHKNALSLYKIKEKIREPLVASEALGMPGTAGKSEQESEWSDMQLTLLFIFVVLVLVLGYYYGSKSNERPKAREYTQRLTNRYTTFLT